MLFQLLCRLHCLSPAWLKAHCTVPSLAKQSVHILGALGLCIVNPCSPLFASLNSHYIQNPDVCVELRQSHRHLSCLLTQNARILMLSHKADR